MISYLTKNKRKGYVTIKLDKKKAYTRLELNFIRKRFSNLGFSNSQINWTIQCITTPSFQVIVSDRRGLSFQPQWGIKQGIRFPAYFYNEC